MLATAEAHAVLEDVRELHRAIEVDGGQEGDAQLLDHHAEERHHGDAAVLDLGRRAARRGPPGRPRTGRRGRSAGVDADVALDDDLGGGLLAAGHEATAGAAGRARASLAILDSVSARARGGGAAGTACGGASGRPARARERVDPLLGELQRLPRRGEFARASCATPSADNFESAALAALLETKYACSLDAVNCDA